MIVATRDGVVLSAPELGQEQKETLLAVIVRSYLQRHPEEVRTGGQNAAGTSTTPA